MYCENVKSENDIFMIQGYSRSLAELKNAHKTFLFYLNKVGLIKQDQLPQRAYKTTYFNTPAHRGLIAVPN